MRAVNRRFEPAGKAKAGLTVLAAALIAAGCGGTDWSQATTSGPGSTVPGASVAAATGEHFVDPQGSYTMTVSRQWTEHTGTIAAEIEDWYVTEPSGGFTPNVNVLTQTARGVDLKQYLDLSIRSGSSLIGGFAVVRSATITGASGQQLGLLEYTGQTGTRDLHFLCIVALRSGQAIVATFSSDEESYAQLEPQVEPFLATLQAT